MTANELRKKFLKYFEERDHKVIPSASLVPENDPTALFISAGMQPLVPFLLGTGHPMGRRLASVQRCIRTDDIEEVGDKVHHTFFEMLGNWSLGDYFKKEAIEFSFEFLTSEKWLGINKEMLAVSVFVGDEDAPFDKEAYDKWIELGISEDRIAKLPKKNNWWGPGESGPSGPDTEMFIWTGDGPAPDKFDDKNPNWVEVWNDVFMEYYLKNGQYTPLAQKNVDTGMGLERMLAVLNGLDDNYKTELFFPILNKISEISGKDYEDNEREFRIIADHVKAAVFAISDGVIPSNKGAGYIVRRLIRRAIVKANQIGIKENFTTKLAEKVFNIYDGVYFDSSNTVISTPRGGLSRVEKSSDKRSLRFGRDDNGNVRDDTKKELEKEENKFRNTLSRGLKQFEIVKDKINGEIAFDLYQTFGFPWEMTAELVEEQGIQANKEEFQSAFKKHQELSRTASAGMFKGGLADAGEIAVKYHTATHLLHAALRKVLGEHVQQKGSNINAERLRFDFIHSDKMTPEQISEVEAIVNEQIEKDLPVTMEEMGPQEAKKSGALGFFEHKYGDKVKVYTIGPSTTLGVNEKTNGKYFSKEICGGPHVTHTGKLGHFKIQKEESSSAGVRRIKAVLV